MASSVLDDDSVASVASGLTPFPGYHRIPEEACRVTFTLNDFELVCIKPNCRNKQHVSLRSIPTAVAASGYYRFHSENNVVLGLRRAYSTRIQFQVAVYALLRDADQVQFVTNDLFRDALDTLQSPVSSSAASHNPCGHCGSFLLHVGQKRSNCMWTDLDREVAHEKARAMMLRIGTLSETDLNRLQTQS